MRLLKAGTLHEFVPKSHAAEQFAALQYNIHIGDLFLIVGWCEGKAAMKKMSRPVTQSAIDAVMNSLASDIDVEKDMLVKHFNQAGPYEIKEEMK